MSVLYKALQKAEKDNEQRQSAASQGFDPQRLAGSGAIKFAGSRSVNWRVATIACIGVLGVAVVAAYVIVGPSNPPPRPQVATLTPQQAQSAAALPKAAPPPSSPEVAATAPQQAAPAAPPAPASQVAQSAPTSAPAAAANPSPVPNPTPAPSSPVPETAVAKAEPAPSLPPANAKNAPTALASARSSTPLRAGNEKMPEIPRDSPAQMLNPPISVKRADFALAGVGDRVQVRQISQDAQDSVGAGYTALLRGEYDTALGFYDRALAKEPTSVLGLLGRGTTLQKMRRFEDAQAAYAKVLKIDPQNREALTNITAIVGERSPAEALNRLLELEKDYPRFSPIKAEIGLIYAKMGTMDAALDYLKRAVALSPESTMYQYNFALVLDHMGLREQAVQAYRNVLDSLASGNGPPELSANDIDRRVRYLSVR